MKIWLWFAEAYSTFEFRRPENATANEKLEPSYFF